MSESYNWATLDNSDAISIKESSDKSYYTLSKTGDEGINLAAPFGRYEKVVKTWELDGIYDDDVVLPNGYYCWKTGVYGYKTGYITKLKIYFADIASTNTTAIGGLALGFCRGTEAELKTKASTILERNSIENSITFLVDGDYYIDASIIEDKKNGLLILPVRSSDLNNTLLEPGNKGYVFTFINNWKRVAEELQPQVISRTRSIFDAGSSLLNNDSTGNESSAKDNSLKMEITFSVDGLSDHLDEAGNFNTYHLSPSTILGLNSLKYYAPILKTKNESAKENIVFSRCYISHDSLTLGEQIDLSRKHLESIQIPINTGNSWISGHRGQATGYISKRNFEISVAFSIEEPDANSNLWIAADHSIAPKTADGYEVIWEITFKKTLPAYPTEKTGMWIKVKNLNDSTANQQQIFCRTYSDYVNNIDKLYLHSAADSNKTIFSRTPDIRVVFDFDGRAQFMEMLYRKISALS